MADPITILAAIKTIESLAEKTIGLLKDIKKRVDRFSPKELQKVATLLGYMQTTAALLGATTHLTVPVLESMKMTVTELSDACTDWNARLDDKSVKGKLVAFFASDDADKLLKKAHAQLVLPLLIANMAATKDAESNLEKAIDDAMNELAKDLDQMKGAVLAKLDAIQGHVQATGAAVTTVQDAVTTVQDDVTIIKSGVQATHTAVGALQSAAGAKEFNDRVVNVLHRLNKEGTHHMNARGSVALSLVMLYAESKDANALYSAVDIDKAPSYDEWGVQTVLKEFGFKEDVQRPWLTWAEALVGSGTNRLFDVL